MHFSIVKFESTQPAGKQEGDFLSFPSSSPKRLARAVSPSLHMSAWAIANVALLLSYAEKGTLLAPEHEFIVCPYWIRISSVKRAKSDRGPNEKCIQ